MPAHRNANGHWLPIGHGYGIIFVALRPFSRGSVTLASADPRQAPVIDFGFLSDSRDMDVLVQGFELARRILAASPFAQLESNEVSPGPAVQSRADIEAHIRRVLVTVHHPSATCRIGDVVDAQLRVLGLQGLRVVDASCGSCTALLARLIDALGVDMSAGADARGRYSIAEALFMGLATDTGWFRFPNARAAEYGLAARLLAAGVDKDAMFQKIEQSSRAERVQLQARALSSLEFVAGGRIAMMRLRAADFADTGAMLEETAGIVNIPMEVAPVRASILAVDDVAAGVIKLSFRSKPADGDGAFIDVNEVAARFGGEEFAIILPETKIEQALILAEKIRAIVENNEFEFESKKFNITVSIGVATTDGDPPTTIDQLIQQSDARLYMAKNSGKNKVVFQSPAP
jgi:nanoRNase/pAp phosphatase (c-di-AMP/oligoRNAs hydrolase)